MPRVLPPKACRCFAICALLALLTGCAHPFEPRPRQGPTLPAPLHLDGWQYSGRSGVRVSSPHYLIYSTVSDAQLLSRVAQVMEGAFGQYHQIAPDVPLSARPMDCYLFADRAEWVGFTRAHTGEDAPVYLRINRGGYTVNDWYVAYFLGDIGTYSVAAHEGFHQYLGRHLKQRIPPFLEEGLACLFEDVTWENRLPRWDLSINYARQTALRQAVNDESLLPLDQLISTHAGQVVNRPKEQIATFYAQCWAFARFMREAEGGRFRPALEKMLADAASGNLVGAQAPLNDMVFWSPRSAKPVLEHYFQMDLPGIEREYLQFIAKIVGQQ